MTTAPSVPAVHYKVENLDGFELFYREAGPADAPVVLLLHGFPTSSHMFRNLIPYLADRFHVIAPDLPGFGQSAAPDHTEFSYTFDSAAQLVQKLLTKLGISRYAVNVFDYGAPTAWRLALADPDAVTALVVQNGNAYDEGLDNDFWAPIKDYWADPSAANRDALRKLVTADLTKFQYTDGMANPGRISPDNWVIDQALLDRPGNDEIQMDYFLDYGTNPALYPAVQQWLRDRQPPTLIVWGANDVIFPADGAHPYKRDVQEIEFHLFDSGHFLLEDRPDEVFPLIYDFLTRKLG
ncbi:alpha/beta hydrolase [Candidatus Mycobacterium wuenschmannii]|uniref:Alpha/beta hydrolase n=1 Tax=Candidatus Mycobacterium wuenschmannii TaxID=3027808 RepID=A0ABY8W095_9MYCO|nr:alpha/beta hydrolase [Candidatus Mycobacterium wuenschmannii]WIM89313.1 alpha/beta hydrolase [Candidatus Mycobacterium wuenschmannii]